MTCCIGSRNRRGRRTNKVATIVLDFTPVAHMSEVAHCPRIQYINFPFDGNIEHVSYEYMPRLENTLTCLMKKNPGVPFFFVSGSTTNSQNWRKAAETALKLISDEKRSVTLAIACNSSISDAEVWAKSMQIPVLKGTPNELVVAMCKAAS